MKFAHMADIHIGGWSDPKMKVLNLEAFKTATDKCIEENVNFILIAGDLFNTALPQIDLMKETAGILKKVKDNNIPIYAIAGSHDFSPSGKTMLDVFEKAGLLHNVTKFDTDGNLKFTEFNNIKITGLLGKKGGLEKLDYENLNKELLEREPGYKIFMFHTAIDEFKPENLKDIEGQPVASLPNNFNYYAGGHIHYIFKKEHGNGLLTFPGALFPNNFKELEEYKHGGFYLVADNRADYVPIKLKEVLTFSFNADNKIPDQLKDEILTTINSEEINDKIVLIRVSGTLSSGKPSDLKFNEIIERLKGAYYIGKNISKLSSEQFREMEIESGSVEEVEKKIIQEHAAHSNLEIENLEEFTQELISLLNLEKNEGEKTADFEKRMLSEASNLLKLDDIFN